MSDWRSPVSAEATAAAPGSPPETAEAVDDLVRGERVTITFGKGPTAFTAVRDADIRVGRGEIVGIVGESGSGKTTLARAVAGLQPITSGTLRIGGNRGRAPRHRTDVQMVFQDPYSSLNPRQTPRAAVTEAIRVRQGLARAQARVAAVDLLASIGIGGNLLDRLPGQLSGGQRQRVSVARALSAEPDLLIADEPTSALDQSAQAQLLNLLRHIQRERHLAVLFISHDLSIIHYLTERVYVMRMGLIVEQGRTEEVFTHPQHEYTRLLIDSIPGRSRT